MSRVNNVQENIISGEIKPRRIKSQGNSCPGGKFWRKTYREEKVWGKDGAKPFGPLSPYVSSGLQLMQKARKGHFYVQLDRESDQRVHIAHMETTDTTPKLFPYE